MHIDSKLGLGADSSKFTGGCLAFSRLSDDTSNTFDPLSAESSGHRVLQLHAYASRGHREAVHHMYHLAEAKETRCVALAPRRFVLPAMGPSGSGLRIAAKPRASNALGEGPSTQPSCDITVVGQLPVRRPSGWRGVAQQLRLALSSAISERLLHAFDVALSLDRASVEGEAQVADVHALLGTLVGGSSGQLPDWPALIRTSERIFIRSSEHQSSLTGASLFATEVLPLIADALASSTPAAAPPALSPNTSTPSFTKVERPIVPSSLLPPIACRTLIHRSAPALMAGKRQREAIRCADQCTQLRGEGC